MELSILLFKKILGMAVMILMGFILRKKEVARNEHLTILSVLLMYIFMPCMVFNSMLMEYSPDRMQRLEISFVVGCFSQVVMILLSRLLGRAPLKADATEQACLSFTNCGNLLVPLILGLLGQEYVFMSIGMQVFNVTVGWLYIPSLLSGRLSFNWKKILLGPGIIATVLGVIVFRTQFPLPEFITSPIGAISDSIGVVSMLFTGMIMADLDILSMLKQGRNVVIALLRLIAIPLVIILLFSLSGLTRNSEAFRDVMLIVTMGAAAPTGTLVVAMSDVYGGRAEFASGMSAMTTLMCIITLPVMVYVYQLLC